MAHAASVTLFVLALGSLVACAAPAEDGSSSASSAALAESEPTCQLREGDFDAALFADLEKTLAPSFSHAGRVSVPGALTATSDPSGFTNLLTVAAATVELDDDPPPTPSALDIMGSFPDSQHTDRTAHLLYDAMTRGTEDAEGNRVSRDGRFECDIIGWKGGNIYHCMLRGLIDTDIVTRPSAICRP